MSGICRRPDRGSIFKVEYLFLDGVYESLRRLAGLKEGVLVAWAICRDGRKALLHIGLGNKESYSAWQDFIRHMVRRGLNFPVMVTTDGAPGLIRAVEETWPASLRQRCLAHKTRNVLDKVPNDAQAEVKAMVRSAYYAPNRELAEMIAQDLLEKVQDRYPAAAKSFTDDLEACWAYLRCPTVHHTNGSAPPTCWSGPLWSKRDEPRPSRVSLAWPGQAGPRRAASSCRRPDRGVFATLWQASQRWQGVRMSEFEQHQLRRLRAELGLLPHRCWDFQPPSETGEARRAA